MEVGRVTNGGLRTRALLVGGGLLLLGMLLAAPAFACTVNADVDVSPAHAAPGVTVAVTGAEFQPELPVRLHLATDDGPVLAETQTDAAGAFNANFVIPADAQGGWTAIIARQAEGPGYTNTGRAVASFFVMTQESAGHSPATNESGVETLPEGDVQTVPPGGFPEPGTGSTPEPAAPAPYGVDEAAPAIDSEPAPQPAPQPATGTTPDAPAAPVAVAQPQPAAPAPSAQQPAAAVEAPVTSEPAAEPVTPSAAVAAPEAAPTTTDTVEAAAGVAPAARALLATAPAAPAEETAITPEAITPQATPQHDTADWAAVPEAADTRGVTGPIGAGIGLLALGLVVLFAGAAVVTTVRPRQTVGAERRRE